MVPQLVTDALAKLQADYDSHAVASSDAAEKKSALDAAQLASTQAVAAVASAVSQVQSSREALVALVNQQYAV